MDEQEFWSQCFLIALKQFAIQHNPVATELSYLTTGQVAAAAAEMADNALKERKTRNMRGWFAQ